MRRYLYKLECELNNISSRRSGKSAQAAPQWRYPAASVEKRLP